MPDPAAALDHYTRLTVENKWKVVKVNVGPGMRFFSGVHPDALKVMLKSGKSIPGQACSLTRPYIPI